MKTFVTLFCAIFVVTSCGQTQFSGSQKAQQHATQIKPENQNNVVAKEDEPVSPNSDATAITPVATATPQELDTRENALWATLSVPETNDGETSLLEQTLSILEDTKDDVVTTLKSLLSTLDIGGMP